MAFMLILKYFIFLIGILKDNIQDFIIFVMIRSIFTFSLNNKIEKTTKLGLGCFLYWKSLLLFNFEPYSVPDGKSDNKKVIQETIEESLFTIFFSELILNIYSINNFCIIFIGPFESWFIINKDFFNINYICHYAHIVIELDKKYNFFFRLHQLDILLSIVFVSKRIDKITCHYFGISIQ